LFNDHVVIRGRRATHVKVRSTHEQFELRLHMLGIRRIPGGRSRLDMNSERIHMRLPHGGCCESCTRLCKSLFRSLQNTPIFLKKQTKMLHEHKPRAPWQELRQPS
jgi:hypothetical protein